MNRLSLRKLIKSDFKYVILALIIMGLSFMMSACGSSGSSSNPASANTNNDQNLQIPDPKLGVVINSIETDACPTVKVYVSIADENSKIIEDEPGLAVQLFEDGIEQTENVSLTWQGNTQAPLSVVFAMDYSLSMTGALKDMENGVKTFIDAMGPEDQAAIIKFYYEPQLMQGLTSDKTALYNAIDETPDSRDYTNIYDTVVEAVNVVAGAQGRPAVILLTDGAHMVIPEYPVRNTLQQAVDTAVQHNIPVFSIALDLRNDEEIKFISEETGGIYSSILDSSVIRSVYMSLFELLGKQHLITYDSSSLDGLEHSIQISAEFNGVTGESIIQTQTLCPAP